MLSWFRRRRSEPTEAAASRGGLTIRTPWVRPDSVYPDRAGGYLTIVNADAEGDRLVGASTKVTAAVEIQGIRVAGGDIRMKAFPDGLAIPAGSTIVLRPHGYHLLLKGLAEPPAVGARVAMTLTFERTGAVEVDMVVEAPGHVGETVLDDNRHPA
ncbi:copper chaperone PCu(A)C [Reyranella sp.]|uniref:copper chaperone PCu(A)C n=1 Tax=Reyranella sp. TaxID=1929291 RepID=UPI003BAA1BB9